MISINKQLIDETTVVVAECDRFGLWPLYVHPMRSKRSTDYSQFIIVEMFATAADAAAFAPVIRGAHKNYAYTIEGGKLKKLGTLKEIEAAAAAAAKSEPKLFSTSEPSGNNF